MQIEANVLSGTGNLLTASRTQARPPLQSEDVSFFTSNLEHSTQPANVAVQGNTSNNILADASTQLVKSTSRMSKGLKAFSTNNSEKEKLNYSTELSNTMLLTQILTKSVGKTAQLVEKISNLQ